MPARIAGFLRNTAPNANCDHCLATSLGIDMSMVARETAILAESGQYKRARRTCSYCGSVQNVITALDPAS